MDIEAARGVRIPDGLDLGLTWGVHVMKALPFKSRKASGLPLVWLIIVLTVSGYLLYYVGSDLPRQIISITHWTLGFLAPVVFCYTDQKCGTGDRAMQ